jgi:hypothetical protein
MLYQLSYSREGTEEWWGEVDSNHCRRMPAGLQPAPFGHSGISPTVHCDDEKNDVELAAGVEPATCSLQNCCSAD